MQCQTILRRVWTTNRTLFYPKRLYQTTPIGLKRQRFISKTINDLKESTDDPIWSLIPLIGGPVYPLTAALKRASIPVMEYEFWQPHLSHTTLEDIVRSSAQQDAARSVYHQQLPPWLLLYLLSTKVQTSNDAANPMFDLLASNLSSLPLHLKPPALIFSAAHLASQNLVVPLRVVVDEFLELPHPIVTPRRSTDPTILAFSNTQLYELYYNLFIRALTHVSKYTPPYHIYVTSLISKMAHTRSKDGRLLVHPETYSALLQATDEPIDESHPKAQRQLLTIPFMAFIKAQMQFQGLQPTPEQSAAVDRFWATAEREKAAKKSRPRPQVPPRRRPRTITGYHSYLAHHHRTQIIPNHGRKLPVPRDQFYLDLHEELWNEVVQRTSSGQDGKQEIGLEDLTNIISLAAEDRNLLSPYFYRVFTKLMAKPIDPRNLQRRLDPTIETYAIVLKGLVVRKDFTRANTLWYFILAASGLQLDKNTLALGARIWTTGGHPDAALKLVQKLSPPIKTPDADFDSSLEQQLTYRRPVALDSAFINEWVTSLRRIGRPDAVFALWDTAYALYGTLHTAQTLNILLQSAKKAVIMNERSIGIQISNYITLGRIKLQGKGKRVGEQEREKGFELAQLSEAARKEAYDRMLGVLGNPHPGKPRLYKGGLWRGKKPEDAAREVFLQVMFGMDLALSFRPTPHSSVVAPAKAVRQSWDSGGGHVGLGVALPTLMMQRYEWDVGREMYRWVPSPHTDSLEPRAHYPHLVLEDSNFFDYLALLSVTKRTTEVALTMAWMRHLQVYPSRGTLTMAMVLWGEVSVESPLVHGLSNLGRWGSKSKAQPTDEYERFVDWIREWVGPHRVPDEDVLRKWRLVIKEMREAEPGPEPTWSHEEAKWKFED